MTSLTEDIASLPSDTPAQPDIPPHHRPTQVLEAAHLVSEITNAAQAHFEVVVLPAVAPSVADHGAAAAALLALLKAAEESVTAVLRRAVDVFVAQVGLVGCVWARWRQTAARGQAGGCVGRGK